MAVKNNPQLATITCPLCQGAATVHGCMIGRGARRQALYIRCGTVSNGCGCIQPYGPTGQEWIKNNMVSDQKPEPEPAPKPETVAEPGQVAANDEWAPDQETESQPVKPKKRGLLAALLEE